MTDAADGAVLDDRMAICDAAASVRAALARMPEAERIAVQLACRTDLTYRGVAARLGIAEDTAKARIGAGMRRLRELLVDPA